MKVAVIGARGRMGRAVVDAITASDGLRLGAAIDIDDSLGDVAGHEVAVIFTSPNAALDAIAACMDASVHCVVGTTGFDAERLSDVERLSREHPHLGILIAPNFAIGAVLMMEFARQAARLFSSIEIVEEHHPDKVDAPSGTAVRTAQIIADARTGMPAMPDATSTALPGARGASVSGVPIHSIRLRGVVANQRVLLGNVGETLTISHDSTDRASFMPGVILAVRGIAQRPGLHIGLETMLDLG